MKHTREQLIAICERSFVPESQWRNRDSAEAQKQLGECYALLRAGCEFGLREDMCTDSTIWLDIHSEGFGYFDWGGAKDSDLFYLPTAKRLDENEGRDWY